MSSTSHELTIGLGQMLVEGGRPEANLSRAITMINEAGKKGCQIIVLPECLDLGWTDSSAKTLAQPIPGPYTNQLKDAAIQQHIYVAAGLVERSKDAFYNSAILLSPQGEIILHHRKINELDIAHGLYSIGDRLGVVHTPLGCMGLDICADNFPSSLVFAHAMARMGAQIILSPSAWAVAANYDYKKHPYGKMWQKAYRSIAKFYQIPMIGVSNVGWITDGPWKGMKCIGCSLAVDSNAKIVAHGSYGESAEELDVVKVHLMPPIAKGTGFPKALLRKGYHGI